MRFLHTSDWHLGRTLEGRSRLDEQAQFIDEICGIADEYKADAVLVAGDVYDTSNPPALAEQLFYEAMGRLSGAGRRGVVVIAGNHDSPERLVAPAPLAHRHGIALLGLPGEEPVFSSGTDGGKAGILARGHSWLEMAVPGCGHTAVILALPYPSEARLKELLQASLEDEAAYKIEYSQRVELIFRQLAEKFRNDTVNMAMSHIFVQGGAACDSERPIFSVGGACTVHPAALPVKAQYTALGHLHRPQVVSGATSPCRYSGSPLAYSFSESGQAKSVVMVDLLPGEPPAIHEIPLSAGRPLVTWRALEGLAQVYSWLDEGRDGSAWIDLEVTLDNPLAMQQIHDLRKACHRFVDIRPVYKALPGEEPGESRKGLSIDRLFVKYYERKFSAIPDQRLVELFMELLGEEDAGRNMTAEEVAV